jgi:hypothetical protein
MLQEFLAGFKAICDVDNSLWLPRREADEACVALVPSLVPVVVTAEADDAWPHILGSHFVTFFMSTDIAAQSSRRRGSSMVSRYSSTLASVCFVFSSAMGPPWARR